MELVVDTNILISFFRPNPVQEFITKSKLLNLFLFTPEYVFEELEKNKNDIMKYSGLNEGGFNEKLSELKKYVEIYPETSYRELKEEAKKLAPHDKDIPIFALALHLKCGIWSNELDFKKQFKIKIFSTRDIVEFFLSSH